MKTIFLFFEIVLMTTWQRVSYAQITATGGVITTDGNYVIHTFSTVGTDVFQVTSGSGYVRYLVVAGGGGGIANQNHGGGGAGGMKDNGDTLYAVTTGSYTVVVGAGGGASTQGGNSSFDAVTAHGGGAAGGNPGGNGGSGGGSNGHSNSLGTTVYPAGVGISGEGNDGGTGRYGSSVTARSGGGGGGAGAVGATGFAGGAGGDGLQSNITGVSIYYAGGGGASHLNSSSQVISSAGGLGGGGGSNNTVSGLNGTDGLGGGGASGTSAGTGGSGVVIIRYKGTVAPLPIDLIHFSAAPVKETNEAYSVSCQWSTATETNTDFFTVEKTQDGITYETVGIITGRGYSSMISNYSMLDRNPYSGTSYYRLKQTDYDGKHEYSNLVAVNLKETEIISIYPNPANTEFEYLVRSRETGIVQVLILDGNGRRVLEKTETISEGVTKRKLNISDLSRGNYILQVVTSKNKLTQKQFIK